MASSSNVMQLNVLLDTGCFGAMSLLPHRIMSVCLSFRALYSALTSMMLQALQRHMQDFY